MLYTLTVRRLEHGQETTRDMPATYWELEDAVLAANSLWECEDYYYTEVVINKTVELCRLAPPKRADLPASE
jgi:hypothetical protein